MLCFMLCLLRMIIKCILMGNVDISDSARLWASKGGSKNKTRLFVNCMRLAQ
ncbi:hypothetical protein CKO_00403 [Citrobacter koseri ATCC BAA-895]|uniref:Uncharacterized protein n=1 Tax=Citrobacter koseri (strain ATCC BAA-895 / CDC 4225-83 / SGSC4696) TaxID=290338 RepID=A8ADJ7_CITK8|nr:hypothetical protein CKO_00403 [Citrobacter koseri ATCC BAA-895]